MVIRQGDVWWAELSAPSGSGPGFRRPVIVVQGDPLNRSAVATVICVPLTSNLAWSDAPGNVLIERRVAGLPHDSVANASQIIAVDKVLLTEHVARLPASLLERVLEGIDIVLDR
jgi:mRNA interferase MazF